MAVLMGPTAVSCVRSSSEKSNKESFPLSIFTTLTVSLFVKEIRHIQPKKERKMSLLAATTAISAAASVTAQFNKITQGAATAGKVVAGAVGFTQGLSGQASLTDVAKLTRAEFFTVVDNDCMNVDFLPDVMQSALSIAIGYYLQAIAIFGSVDAAKVVSALRRVTPTAHYALNAGGGSGFNYTGESYSMDGSKVRDGSFKMSLESYKWRLPTNDMDLSLEAKDGGSFREVQALTTSTNLAVGKMIEVQIADSNIDPKSKVTLLISFKLNVAGAPSQDVVTALSLTNRDTTFIERYHSWKMGDIAFWKDLVLCEDLIKERKKLMMGNKDGAVAKMIERSNTGRISGLLNGKPTLGSATAIFVMSTNTVEELEKRLSGSITSVNVRNKIFQSGHMMILIVIDKAYERVTFYHRDIAEPTELSLRDMKMANKDSGPNLTDIMKAFMMGSSPTF
jgi:hypothetical protein